MHVQDKQKTAVKEHVPYSMSAVSLLGACLVCIAGGTRAASAQVSSTDSSTDVQSSHSERLQLEEITVTARKKTENLDDVPIAVTAVSAGELESAHAQTLEDLASTVPGLSFVRGGNSGSNDLVIRGITPVGGAAPAVGIYLNDTPISSLALGNAIVGQPDLKLFDLERLEVLKGPQGTLYGGSSLGGTVKYVTAEPVPGTFSQAYTGQVSGTDDGGLNHLEKAIFNIPLTDEIAARAGFQYNSDSGYIDHLANAPVPGFDVGTTVPLKHSNFEEDLAFHLTFAIHVSEPLLISPSLFYQRLNIGDTSYFDGALGPYTTSRRILEPSVDDSILPAVVVKYDFNHAQLTSSTSYFERDSHGITDLGGIDSAYQGYLAQQTEGYGGAFISNLLSAGISRARLANYTQEFRLASVDTGNLSGLIGLFYNHGDGQNKHSETSYGTNAATELLYGLTPEAVFGVPFPDDVVFNFYQKNTTDEKAVFGQVYYKVTDKITATAGLRYFSEGYRYDTVQSGFYAPSTIPPGSPAVLDLSTHEDGTTPKVNLAYQITPAALLYLDASKGYRFGGPNQVIPASLCGGDVGTSSYGPDHTWNYEAGYKGQMFDRRLIIEASAFFIRWSQVQQGAYLPQCGFGYTVNSGDAVSKGGELAIRAKPFESLSVSANFGYTDATFTTADADIGVAIGNRLLYVPLTSESFNADYVIGTYDRFKFVGRLSASHQSAQTASLQNYVPITRIDAFSIVNAQIGLEAANWSAALYGINLSNAHGNTASYNSNYANTQYATFRPRTIGLELNRKF